MYPQHIWLAEKLEIFYKVFVDPVKNLNPDDWQPDVRNVPHSNSVHLLLYLATKGWGLGDGTSQGQTSILIQRKNSKKIKTKSLKKNNR